MLLSRLEQYSSISPLVFPSDGVRARHRRASSVIMALVERMSILGIRSFGHETPQKIEFFTPVTLILGPNGTGKTTIIECLKYSTTGDLPPGSKTGCSFIHDPRIARETEVKAKVTLQMRDVRGQPMIVSRALVATQRDKAKQGTLKTLDGSIKRQLPDGNITSISSKCAEIDQEMVTSLGVSKAVLENVIFCHQEDSNWPLQEAKSVKQRFDDLFASSRYVKALDAMRKCKQEKDTTIKVYKAELKHLSKSRDEAAKIRCEREELQHSIDKQEQSLASVTTKLNPIVEQLNLYKQKYAELIQLQAQLKSHEAEKAHLEEAVSNLLANIKEEFDGTNEELSTLVEDSGTELERKQLNLSRLEEAEQVNRVKMRESEAQRNKAMVEIAQLELHVKNLSETISNRNSLLRSAIEQYNLAAVTSFLDSDSTMTEEHVMSVTSELQRHMDSTMEVELRLKERVRKLEAEETERVNQTINELARVEHNHEETQRCLRETRSEITSLKRRVENAKSVISQMESVRTELLNAEAHADQLCTSCELEDTREQLRHLSEVRKATEQSLLALDEKIATLQQNSSQRQQLDVLRKDRNSKFESARKIRSRHLEALEQVFGTNSVPTIISEADIAVALDRSKGRAQQTTTMQDRLRHSFLTRLSSLEQSTREARKRLAKYEQDKSVLETKAKFTRSQLQGKQKQADQMAERILSAAGSADLEQCLSKLQQRRKLLEEECANEQGSLYLWSKFRDRLARSDPDCPVCHRQLSDRSEQDELLAELDQRIESMPGEFERKKVELAQLVTQHETLLELRPIYSELEHLRNTDIPALEAQLNTELENLQTARDNSEQETARLEACHADEALARSIQGDLAVFERMENDIIELSGKIARLQAESGETVEGSETMDALQEERRTLRDKQISVTSEMTKLQDCVQQLDEAQRDATDTVHRIKDNLHKLEQENQANLRLTDDIARLSDTEKQLQKRLQELESHELPKAKQAKHIAVSERTAGSATREKELEESAEKTGKLRDLIRQVDQACAAVSTASKVGSKHKLAQLQQQLTNLEQNIAHLHGVAERNTKDLEIARQQVHEHKIRQRELTDCVQLRQLRSQMGQLTLRIEDLSNRLASCHSVTGTDQDLVQETKRLSSEEERLQAEKHAVTNQLGQLTAKLQYLERDLKEKYAESDREYLDMMYQLKVGYSQAHSL
ncbi:DNA repair protein rad50, partial [Clonorchis sinensis]